MNKSKLNKVTRECIKRILDKENLTASSIWAEDMHGNTDHPYSYFDGTASSHTEKTVLKGVEPYRGKFK